MMYWFCGMIQTMKKIIAVIVLACAALLGVSVYTSKYSLACSYYEIASDQLDHDFRVVQLTDLHNSVFGENTEKLVELVRKQEPDLILFTGDLLNYTEETADIAVGIIEQLQEIAPLYVSYGNHEDNYERKYGTDITELYEAAGAHVLNYAYEDIEVNGQKLRLGGIYGYCLPDIYARQNGREHESAFLKEFQDTNLYTVLMCHMPVCWIINGSLDAWDIDCVLSGHSHGGQVQIPFVGGLYAPDQGWFCGKEYGTYYSSDNSKVMVLSRGLGNTEKIPRINNIPEVVVIDFTADYPHKES